MPMLLWSIVLFVALYLAAGVYFALACRKVRPKARTLTTPDGETIVDPSIYDADYYLNAYSGTEEAFVASLDSMPNSLAKCFSIGQVKPGERVLDIGCGKGQLAYYCVKQGCEATALDYSEDAANLARRTACCLPAGLQEKMKVICADFLTLDESVKYDVIFMADLVEHLYDWQLKKLFEKAGRLLSPTGRIVIHTAPNRLFINFLFPLKRILAWPKVLARKKDFFYTRSKYCYDPAMHVNEQTPQSLAKHLRDFRARIWCDDGSSNLLSVLTSRVFGADIWAVARLKERY